MSIECAFFGALSRDAEVKTSSKGKSYVRLNVRVGQADAQWVNVLCFDQQAIELAGKLTKGAKVYVEGGGLKIDQWTGQDGATRHGLSCMSWHCRLAEIGRNRRSPKSRPKITSLDVATPSHAAKPGSFYSDEIGF
jgi:single-stranded DNA-binding protein